MSRRNNLESSKKAGLCLPALVYLVVGLANIGVEMVGFVNEHVKTNEEFLRICIKIVVIFLVTIGVNLLCVNRLFYLSVIITVILVVYLSMDLARILYRQQNNGNASIFLTPMPVQSNQIRMTERPNMIRSLKDGSWVDPYEFMAAKVVPNEKIIGLNSRE